MQRSKTGDKVMQRSETGDTVMQWFGKVKVMQRLETVVKSCRGWKLW